MHGVYEVVIEGSEEAHKGLDPLHVGHVGEDGSRVGHDAGDELGLKNGLCEKGVESI